MHPHEIIWCEDLFQVTRKAVVDPQIPAKIAARKFGKINTIVKNWPKNAIGETAIVFLMVLAGKVDCDEGNVPMNSPLRRDRRKCCDLSAPAKPSTGSL